MCARKFIEFGGAGKKLVGDKNNVNWEHLFLLRKMYPKCKFIFLLRDPRAIYRSLQVISQEKAYEFSPQVPEYTDQFLDEYGLFLDRIEHFVETAQSKFLVLRFENLVLEPEQEMEKVRIFLELDSPFETSNFFLRSSEPPELLPWKMLTLGEIDPRRAGAWRDSISTIDESSGIGDVVRRQEVIATLRRSHPS